jgi:hypothetical protein
VPHLPPLLFKLFLLVNQTERAFNLIIVDYVMFRNVKQTHSYLTDHGHANWAENHEGVTTKVR